MMIWNPRYFRYCTVLVVIGGLFSAFYIGIDRGFEHTIGVEAWGRIRFATCSAITDLAHHGPGGYVCNSVVETVLEYAGLTQDQSILEKLGTTFPDNLRDQSLIDSAITKAVAFPILPAHDKFRGAGSDDVGMVDFVKFAFELFGYHLTSFYLSYFVIFICSVFLFILGFWRNHVCLTVIAIVSLAHLAMFRSSIFDFTGSTFGTVTNPRFLSELAVIPGLHIAFAMMSDTRLSWRHGVLVGLQALIIVFAVSIRAVALWVPFGIAIWGVLLWATRRSLRVLWPVGMLSAICLGYMASVMWSLNPVYAVKGGTGYHTFWHSIYYSLQLHPEWDAKYGAAHHHAIADQQPWAGAEHYLEEHPRKEGDPPLYFLDGYPNYAAMEKYVRAAFFEFVSNDPKFVIETFLIYKPKELYLSLSKYVVDAAREGSIILGCIFVIGLLATFFACHRSELCGLAQSVCVVTGAFFVSTVPLLVTVPMISDDLFVAIICAGLWALMLSSALGAGALVILKRVGGMRTAGDIP